MLPRFPQPGTFVPQQDEQQIIPPGQDSIPVDVPAPSNQIGPMGGPVDPRTGMRAPPLPVPQDNGGVDIEGAEDILDQQFNANLADELDDSDRFKLADEFVRWVDVDRQSMQERQVRLADGLQILGVTEIPTTKAAFKGAACVTFPLLSEAVVQFQARAIDEMFPPAGPVKAITMGNTGPSEIMMEQAQRA